MAATGHMTAGDSARLLHVIGFTGLIEGRDVLVRGAFTDLPLILARKIALSFV